MHAAAAREHAAQTTYDRNASLGTLFAEVAAQFGASLAVVSELGSLTYAELLSYAHNTAARLQQQGIVAGDTVGILSRRTPQTIAHILGALIAGAAYMPVDPCATPSALLGEQVQAAGIRALLWDSSEVPAQLSHLPVIAPLNAGYEHAPHSVPHPDAASPAYLMFTSGSSGAPKGVAVPNRAITRLVREQQYARFGSDERVLLHSPLTFDASTFEIWSALLHGGTLVLAPDRALALGDYASLIAEHGITTLWLTAAVFHLSARQMPGGFAGLQQLLVGGDVVSPESVVAVQRACPRLRIINGYGPTESTTFALTYTVPAGYIAAGPLPIGNPIAHTTAYILDEALEPIPDGQEGQLALGGDGIALGYVGQPRMTAERFHADPFSPHPDARLYLTGDRVMRDGDGLVHFRGRLDQEVKIAGRRVQLGEVEALLAAHPSVQHAAVFVRGALAEDKQIAAIVEPMAELPARSSASLAIELRSWLGDRLPRYAIPATLRLVHTLPLNAHGKLDRAAALARLDEVVTQAEPTPVQKPEPAQATALDAVLASWKTLLESDEIAPDTNFFDAGGDSLLLIQLHWRLNKLDRGAVDLIELFSASTPRKMSALLDQPAAVR